MTSSGTAVVALLLLVTFAVISDGIRINCGGDELPGGFISDNKKYTNSTTREVRWHWENPTGAPKSVIVTHAYARDFVPLIYKVPVPNVGITYDVTLTFGENWGNRRRRLNDVYVNSMLLAENLDVFEKVGFMKPYKLMKKNMKPLDGGYFEVSIVPKRENAFISAIEIIPRMKAPKLEPSRKLSISFDKRLEDYPIKVFEAGGTVMGWRKNKYLVVFTGFYQFPGVTPAVYQRKFTRGPAKWERLKNVPAPTSTHYAQACYGDTCCLVGGYQGTHPGRSGNKAWCFNRAKNTYTKLPDLPGDRAGGGLSIIVDDNIGKRILVYAGGVDRTSDSFAEHIDYGTTWTLMLATRGAKWELVADEMPVPRNHMAALSVCGRHFFVGGQKELDEENGNSNVVSEFIPRNRTWSKYPPKELPIPLGHISASLMKYKCGMVVVGGITTGRKQSKKVLYWDPKTNEWSTIGEYPIDVATPVCGIFEDQIMCATGGSYSNQDHAYIGTIKDD